MENDLNQAFQNLNINNRFLGLQRIGEFSYREREYQQQQQAAENNNETNLRKYKGL